MPGIRKSLVFRKIKSFVNRKFIKMTTLLICMSIPKCWLLGWWYPRGRNVHQQWHRPRCVNSNQIETNAKGQLELITVMRNIYHCWLPHGDLKMKDNNTNFPNLCFTMYWYLYCLVHLLNFPIIFSLLLIQKNSRERLRWK